MLKMPCSKCHAQMPTWTTPLLIVWLAFIFSAFVMLYYYHLFTGTELKLSFFLLPFRFHALPLPTFSFHFLHLSPPLQLRKQLPGQVWMEVTWHWLSSSLYFCSPCCWEEPMSTSHGKTTLPITSKHLYTPVDLFNTVTYLDYHWINWSSK